MKAMTLLKIVGNGKCIAEKEKFAQKHVLNDEKEYCIVYLP